MTVRPTAGDVAELVRLPAVASIPGNVLVGAAAADRWEPGRVAGTVLASSCVYLAGMALNDWADRAVDARERPSRPIPSGRVTPAFALGTAVVLTGAGLGLAALSGGRDALKVMVPLAGTAWLYDLALKDTPAGPLTMAAARTLNVLAGAGGAGARAALPEAATVGAHTAVITVVSCDEVEGSDPRLGMVAGTATAGIAAVTAARARDRGRGLLGWITVLATLAAYLADLVDAAAGIVRDPVPDALQRFVGRGIRAFPRLDAGLLAGRGRIAAALALAGLPWLADRLAGEVSTT